MTITGSRAERERLLRHLRWGGSCGDGDGDGRGRRESRAGREQHDAHECRHVQRYGDLHGRDGELQQRQQGGEELHPKASVTLTGDGLNGSGYFGTYDGQAHAATATVTGVGGAISGRS